MRHAEIIEFMRARGAALIGRTSLPTRGIVIIKCYLCDHEEHIPWAEKQTSEARLQQHKIDCPHIS